MKTFFKTCPKFIFIILSLLCYTFTLPAQSKIDSTIIRHWHGKYKQWSATKYTYYYNEQNLIETQVSQRWKEQKKFWKNESRYTKKYNEQGYQIESFDEYCTSKHNERWSPMPVVYTDYEYYESGEISKIITHHTSFHTNKKQVHESDVPEYKKTNKNQLKVQDTYKYFIPSSHRIATDINNKNKPAIVRTKICGKTQYEYQIKYDGDGKYRGYTEFKINPETKEKTLTSVLVHYYKEQINEPILFSLKNTDATEAFNNNVSNKNEPKVTTNPIYNKKESINPYTSTNKKQALKKEYKNQWKLYPNPANEYILIELIDYSPATISVEIFDQVGKRMQQQSIAIDSNQKIKINIERLVAGMYTVVIRSKQSLESKRFIKG